MSEVSFIRAAPSQSPPATRRPADAPDAADRDDNARNAKTSAPPALPNKTKVQTEQLAKYAYGYTFIDAETSQVVGRYPAEPFVSSHTRVNTTI